MSIYGVSTSLWQCDPNLLWQQCGGVDDMTQCRGVNDKTQFGGVNDKTQFGGVNDKTQCGGVNDMTLLFIKIAMQS